jgi:hypothetical protein
MHRVYPIDSHVQLEVKNLCLIQENIKYSICLGFHTPAFPGRFRNQKVQFSSHLHREKQKAAPQGGGLTCCFYSN